MPSVHIMIMSIRSKTMIPAAISISAPIPVCGLLRNNRSMKGRQRVKRNNLYTAAGWIDAARLLDCPEPFVLALGGRGIGKSYGVLKLLYERETPFIYMRRTQAQIDAVAVPQLNPFNQISADLGRCIVSDKLSKHTAGFYNAELNEEGQPVKTGEPFGIGIALSTFAAIRSLSAERYEVLFFDEIIPERHERPIKEEGLAFANVLESLNRNRELKNEKPIKVILVSNSNTINSQILKTIGVVDIVDEMTRKNITFKSVNGLIAIFRYLDSPISEKKKRSALYQVIKNEDFQNMSINNEFAAGDYENVGTMPLTEFTPVCSYGNTTVCKHKSRNIYYCITGIKATDRFNTLPLSTRAFQRKYYYVYGAMLDKRVYYQSVSVKMEIEGAFK